MQATPAPTPADIAAQLAAETLQAHRTALQTLEKLMLHAAEALMNPTEEQKNEDPARARTTTQRLRLVMQAARDILRFGGVAPPSPGSAGEGARRSSGGRMRVPLVPVDASTPVPHGNAAQEISNLPAAAGFAVPCDGRRSRPVPEEEQSEQRSASASFGERISPFLPRDSSLIIHHSLSPDPPPSSVLSVSSVVNGLSISGDSSRVADPALPEPPAPFHPDEVAYINISIQKSRRNLPLNLYNKAKAWHDYTTATGVESPYNFNWPRFLKHEPSEPLDVIRR